MNHCCTAHLRSDVGDENGEGGEIALILEVKGTVAIPGGAAGEVQKAPPTPPQPLSLFNFQFPIHTYLLNYFPSSHCLSHHQTSSPDQPDSSCVSLTQSPSCLLCRPSGASQP